MNARSSAVIGSGVVKSIMQSPKSRKQICIDLDIPERRSTALNKYLRALRADGLIYVSGWTLSKREIFAFQRTPFEMPDVERPANNWPKREKLQAMPKVAPKVGVASVFALGAL